MKTQPRANRRSPKTYRVETAAWIENKLARQRLCLRLRGLGLLSWLFAKLAYIMKCGKTGRVISCIASRPSSILSSKPATTTTTFRL
jgi:hypothetical protein